MSAKPVSTSICRFRLVRARLAERFTLEDIDYATGGPARYVRVKETGGRLGFITPMTHNFCESCNRVRITCTGTLFMCLGQEDAADLRTPLRASESDERLHAAIDEAILRKPKGHDFVIDRRHSRPAVVAPYEHDRRLSVLSCLRLVTNSRSSSARSRAGAKQSPKRSLPASRTIWPVIGFIDGNEMAT